MTATSAAKTANPASPANSAKIPARYSIGIDLGTTNCAVSYIDLSVPVSANKPPKVDSLPVAQLVGEGNVADKVLLPSFLYLAGEHDLPAGSLKLPWDAARRYAVGEFARNQGARVPGRLVSSAKSWLCHAAVDRTADILPWGGLPDVKKVSPVEASARYLAHMREAWNVRMAGGGNGGPGDERLRMENQDIVLTVPASFDAVARELTVEAATRAGLPRVTLLEEPQAAFYWWIVAHFDDWWNHVRPGTLVLVCDVGGGTTDFSLIAVTEGKAGGLGFERFAVGDHLILGGDNMDVALARKVESRLAAGKPAKLDIVQWAGLVQACRAAKERLLSGEADKVPIALVGRGSSVIGGSLRGELSREEVRETVMDGFLPATGWDEEPAGRSKAGLQELGLPYASDPAIPRHLSSFLRKHLAGGRGRVAAVLFNGGVFNPPAVRERLVDVVKGWMSAEHPFGEVVGKTADGKPEFGLTVLENKALDLAVAHGAAYYGLVRKGKGIRIAGGTARSYYVGIAGADEGGAAAAAETPAEPSAAPAADAPPAPAPVALSDPTQARTTVLCVAPAGLEEGQEVDIADRQFELITGRPVSFPLFSSSLRPRDKTGQLLVAEEGGLVPLSPIRTVLSAGKKAGAKTIPVHLRARVTEVGTLELFCVSRVGDRSWRLQFQVRGATSSPTAEADSSSPAAEPQQQAVDAGAVLEEQAVTAALDLVRSAFGMAPKHGKPADPPVAPPQLMKRLEEALDLKRDQWPTSALRRLWDPLFEALEQRKLTPEHEARWLNLAGFCLRPGFGDPLDEWRIKRLWGINYTGLAHIKNPQNWVEWWTLWRRTAGGLSAAHQNDILGEVGAYLHPSLRRGKGPKPGRVKAAAHEFAEMWRLAGALERLDPAVKERIGEAVWADTPPAPAIPYKPQLNALARVGARTPLYAPVNLTVHPTVAERWITALMARPWDGSESDAESAGFAAAQLARRTGDRARDIDDALRAALLRRLESLPLPPAKIAQLSEPVREVVEFRAEERSQLFGDQLPSGLRLVASGGGV